MSNKKTPRNKYYKRPEFYLIVLTTLLWLAFLYKVIIHEKHNHVVEAPIDLKKKPKTSLEKTPNKLLKIQSRDKANKSPPLGIDKKTEGNQEQTVLEALNESLDKTKPADNHIIRGETLTLIHKSGRNANAVTELVIDNKNLKRLNDEYMKALESEPHKK